MPKYVQNFPAKDVLDIISQPDDRTSLEQQLARNLPTFTPTQQRLVTYILRYPNDAAFLSASELSREVGVSEAAVSRFIRAAGFLSFSELRNSLAKHLHQKLGMASRLDKRLQDLEAQDDFFPSFIYGEIEYLQKSLQSITSADIDRCSELVRTSRRVFLAGHRASLSVREMLDYRFSRLKIEIIHLTDSERYLLDKAQFMTKDDVLLCLTFQRIPADLRIIFDVAVERNVPSILITDLPLIPKTLDIDVVLSASRGPQNVSNTFTVPMVIASAIVWAVARKLGSEGHATIAELDRLRQRYGYGPVDPQS